LKTEISSQTIPMLKRKWYLHLEPNNLITNLKDICLWNNLYQQKQESDGTAFLHLLLSYYLK
jgi:hypothetical protein